MSMSEKRFAVIEIKKVTNYGIQLAYFSAWFVAS